MKKENHSYYLGLDIGTDSIGYAVTDKAYHLLKFHGEPMWGGHLFDEASPAAERRAARVARRRLDRRQARVKLLRELFATEIAKIDPHFFKRIDESWLFPEDKSKGIGSGSIFNDPDFKDADYHHRYPTIHHLIYELMCSEVPHDVRLVYLACAWLVAHRGHFLSDISVENVAQIKDVKVLYDDLMSYLSERQEQYEQDQEGEDGEKTVNQFWDCDPVAFGNVLRRKRGITAKKEDFAQLLYGTPKLPRNDTLVFSPAEILSLLSGGVVKAGKLFASVEEEDAKDLTIELGAADEKIEEVCAQLGDEAELIQKLKALYDWSVLAEILGAEDSISAAKVKVYEQHKRDLAGLKTFLRKKSPALYREVFVVANEKEANYVAYVNNKKGTKHVDKVLFCEWLLKKIKTIKPDAEDVDFYNDMTARLSKDMQSFLPKQVEGDNRVIPYQVYLSELRQLLKRAERYLPFLTQKDADGLSVSSKIDSIMSFRIPYYVGPLVSKDRSKNAWLVRKAEGRIFPWNFDRLVDKDACEQEFINRMTNTCTYLAGEDVLPECSLVYQEFKVLNEINCINVLGVRLTDETKAKLIDEVYRRHKNVTRSRIVRFLISEGLIKLGEDFGGLDENPKNSLGTFHDFKVLLQTEKLSVDEVETIVLHSTFTEDKGRYKKYLEADFGTRLSSEELKKVARKRYVDFGRLSRRFLEGIEFECCETGERGTVLDFMRRHSVLLMELLSDRYTLQDKLAELNRAYYDEHPKTMAEKMDEMRLSAAVKRQVYRTFDIVKSVRKATGREPKKVFVEMARGGMPDQKGKRTKSRYERLKELLARIRTEDVRAVNDKLAEMGDSVNNRLQSDALFLWCVQLGRCPYCGTPIPLESIKVEANIDHILPQSKVKDDSLLDNLVLAHSKCNGPKTDRYPVPQDHRQEALWSFWRDNGLITEKKFQRLMRCTPLSEDELQGFINRQLVETRQTTKAVVNLLQELMPETEIVPVHAGLVSDFRHEYEMLKCRSINDLHHAKDAFLNIVVGNVYHEKFTKQFFRLGEEPYSMKIETLFSHRLERGGEIVWTGQEQIGEIKATVRKNCIHLTKYSYFSKGALFDINPVSAGNGQLPLKQGVNMTKYGAYNSLKAFGFMPVGCMFGKKRDLLLCPVNMIEKESLETADEEKAKFMMSRILKDVFGKEPSNLVFPLGQKVIKIGSLISVDGFRYSIRGKTNKSLLVGSMMPVVTSETVESYVKRVDSKLEKLSLNKNLSIDAKFDKLTKGENLNVYDEFLQILKRQLFMRMPGNQSAVLEKGRETFARLGLVEQLKALKNIVLLLKTNRGSTCDLSLIGGAGRAGLLTISANGSAWKKNCHDVRLIYTDAAGLFEKKSRNLLELV